VTALKKGIENSGVASGRVIIESIVDAMSSGLEELYTRTIAPELFQVYLHPSDYQRLEGIFRVIQDEAGTALDERIAVINRAMGSWPAAFASKLLERLAPHLGSLMGIPISTRSREARKVTRPRNGWQVTFNRNEDPEAEPGDIVIDAVLMLPQKAELGVGLTTKSVRTFFRQPPTNRGSVQNIAADSSIGTLHFKVGSPPQLERADPPQPVSKVNTPTEALGPGVKARLRLRDNEGEKTYEMTKSSVVIGRGGTGVWTDVKLVAGPNVSREHLRIKETNGQFFLKDISAFGTSINGISVPGSMVRSGVQFIDNDIWVPLPSPSRISLAGVIEIEFVASGEKI